MLVYDDQTLIATRKRSPLDRGLLARALRNIDAMGAKSIGIDILFDQPQDEDGELLSVLRAMLTPVWLGYANLGDNQEQIIRSEEHTSELQSLMRISYAVFCLKKKKQHNTNNQ